MEAKFIKRLNRFTALLEEGKEILKAYIPNSGRLEGLLEEGKRCYLVPGRGKLKYKIVGVKENDIWVSIDSHLPERAFEEWLNSNLIVYFKNWQIKSKQFYYKGKRIDFLLKHTYLPKYMLLEVKSCTLVKADTALFPDAPTQRGREQVKILMNAIKDGFSAMILFVVQREDASKFRPNEGIDPLFVKYLNLGLSQGLLLSYIRCSYKPPQTLTYLDFKLLS